MKKLTLNTLAVSLAGVMAVGCSSTPEKTTDVNSLVGTSDTCLFPKTTTEAPKWVCSDLSDMDGIYAVGVAEPTKSGISHQRKIAMLDAKTQIAARLQANVSSLVKNYAGTTGMGDTETVDAVSSSVSKELVHQKLEGVTRKATAYDPQGRLYVLAGINNKYTAKLMKTALKSSYAKKQAQWQQLQSDKAFDELNKEVEKQYGKDEQ
jgi:hypothetical protein